MFGASLPLALSVVATLLGPVPLVAADCTREGLLATANSYVAAQMAGKVDGLKLSPDFVYQENNKKVDTKKALINTALKLDMNRSTADTVACASYTMWISTTGSKPYVVSTQIRHPADGDTATIAMIDSVIASTGALFFNASLTLRYLKAEDWSELPPGDRPARDLLKKYGDGYLDMWTDAKAAGSMQWGTICERVEGSRLTKPCGASLPRGGSSKPNGNRRYVIDEVFGSVDVLCSFDSLGPWPDSHEIRVEGGKVKYVHTVTVM